MIFSPESCELILAGRKTQTRRPRKIGRQGDIALGEINEGGGQLTAVDRNSRVIWQVGRTYAVQPGRNKKAIARIRLTSIDCEKISDISDEDAMAEGIRKYEYEAGPCDWHTRYVFRFRGIRVQSSSPREAFLLGWKRILYPKSDLTELVWILTFELVKE